MSFELNFLKTSKNPTAKTRKKISFFNIFFGFIFVLLLSYLLHNPQQKAIVHHELEVGDIVKEDITIKKDITIEDKESTEENRKRAIENIIPIYEYYAENQAKSQDLIMRWFNLIRTAKKDYIKNKKELANIKERIAREFGMDLSNNEIKTILGSAFFSKVDLNRLLGFIKSLYDKKILASLTGARRSKNGTIKLVSKTSEANVLNVDELYDLKKAEMALIQFIKDQKLPTRSPDVIASILKDFIDVNISYSINLTREEEQKVSAAVNPVLIKLKTGKVILRKGDEVQPEDLRILKLIAYEEKIREQRLSDFYLILLILGLLSLFGGKFFKVWQSGGINRDKIFIVMSATLIVSAIIYRVCYFLFPLILKNITLEINYDMQSIFFAIPFGFGVLAVAFIFNLQSAVIFSFANAIMGGIICHWDFRIALYILLGNLAVSFGIEYLQRLKRSPIIKAAILWMLPVNIVTILVFNLTESNVTLQHISVDMVLGLFSAVTSPILATFIIPLWETIFKLVTDLKLIELTNLNLPIFREMLEKAPGTYHHSQMVASLSETAAQDLGLSPLLQTAMALYHDIGKIDNPQFFTENHSLYKNPHESLSPRESAKNIISHIPDGLERAEKLKLHPLVSSSIRQHHGTKVVRFFYDKAREMSSVESDGFEDKVYRYPGEKPKTIENAIIMLADQVEAASKSLAPPTDEEIKNVIRKIIDSNINENQFDECEGLTFKALNSIANSFHKKLSSIYHIRISYPGFDFKEKKENEK
jgi:putative nucleotidyltransferase with HDIG domain